ncbi:MAG: flagellar basal-body rod protein FlgC [Actinomycetota bacterium]|jgi:flagellar basal-body rod protein FlgC|nr:flagellar basal-body rod protein FlgC [Actinomycetota bacterium]
MATTAANVANDVTPGYQAKVPLVAANGLTGGVVVTGIAKRTDPPNVNFDPGSPVADSRGLVNLSNVDLSVEMPNLLMATDYTKLNAAVMARVQETYQSIVDLGKS